MSAQVSEEELQARLARISEAEASTRATLTHRILQRVGPTRAFGALYRRLGPLVDPWLLRRTGGRYATQVAGLPALLLTSTGAVSGKRRTSPLLYARDGEDFLVVGTNFGTERHPAWTGNLLKHPDAEVEVGGEVIPVRAELQDAEGFERLWPRFSALYSGYDSYLERLTHRTPRMFRLRPTPR